MELETLNDIKNLITSDTETDKIEFKKTTGQLECGMETLCAFLNQEGGTVLFGVTDEGKITGQEVAGKTKETIGEAISRLEPGAQVRISYISIPESEVLESWGRGIGLIISECRRVGIPDPEFHTDGNSVWVIFRYTRRTVGYDPTVTRQLPHKWRECCPQSGNRSFRPKRLWV